MKPPDGDRGGFTDQARLGGRRNPSARPDRHWGDLIQCSRSSRHLSQSTDLLAAVQVGAIGSQAALCAPSSLRPSAFYKAVFATLIGLWPISRWCTLQSVRLVRSDVDEPPFRTV